MTYKSINQRFKHTITFAWGGWAGLIFINIIFFISDLFTMGFSDAFTKASASLLIGSVLLLTIMYVVCTIAYMIAAVTHYRELRN
jgi:cell division protein FtsX